MQMTMTDRVAPRRKPGERVREYPFRLSGAVAGVVLCALQAGCAIIYPPIDALGSNCESYGVSERQKSPMDCPLGADGLPVVEQVSFSQIQELCIGDSPVSPSFYIWGCVAPKGEGGINQAYAIDKAPSVYRHEQCHCILGPAHNDRY